jgi:hypothetical protein
MDRAVDTPLAEAVARGWRVNGEVDKVTSYIPGRAIPDFIWHVPGTTQNGHVVEVKRATARLRSIRADVQKLQSFKQVAGYQQATLLVVGTRMDSRGFDSLLASAELARVNVMFHDLIADQLAETPPSELFVVLNPSADPDAVRTALIKDLAGTDSQVQTAEEWIDAVTADTRRANNLGLVILLGPPASMRPSRSSTPPSSGPPNDAANAAPSRCSARPVNSSAAPRSGRPP